MAGSGASTELGLARESASRAGASHAGSELTPGADAPTSSRERALIPGDRRLDLERIDARFRVEESLAALEGGTLLGTECADGARLSVRARAIGIWRRREVPADGGEGDPAPRSLRDAIARRIVRRLVW